MPERLSAPPADTLQRIHILGASGSGTTTLAHSLAASLNLPAFDTDDFFWLPTQPPFTHKRPVPERLELMQRQVLSQPSWVLSGSLCGWGDALIPEFTLVIRLVLDPELRLERLKQREISRYGVRIAAGGEMHQTHLEFMTWAASYDQGGTQQRSAAMHDDWTARLSCPLIILDSSQPPDRLAEQALSYLKTRV